MTDAPPTVARVWAVCTWLVLSARAYPGGTCLTSTSDVDNKDCLESHVALNMIQMSAHVTAPTQGSDAPEPKKIQWLHIQKTGSTFGNTIYRVACAPIPAEAGVSCGQAIWSLTDAYPPDEYCSDGIVDTSRVDGHSPATYPEDYGKLVALFREPVSRKVSYIDYMIVALNDVEYGEECGFSPDELRELNFVEIIYETATAAYEDLETVGTEAKCAYLERMLKHIFGGQAKMAVGMAGNSPITDETVQANVSNKLEVFMPAAFLFIGLQDRWNESVCLLHLQRSSYPAMPVEFANARPTPKTGVDWEAEAEACGMQEQLLVDELDDRAYDLAKQSFNSSLLEAEERFPGQMASCLAAAAAGQPWYGASSSEALDERG